MTGIGKDLERVIRRQQRLRSFERHAARQADQFVRFADRFQRVELNTLHMIEYLFQRLVLVPESLACNRDSPRNVECEGSRH